MRKIVIIIFGILASSCKENTTDNVMDNLDDNTVRVMNVEEYATNTIPSFAHYLYIKNAYLPDTTLIKMGQNYIDSLKTNKPVFVLALVSSKEGFTISPEDNYLDEIRKNTFAKLNYRNTLGPEQGEFEKITRYNRK